MKTKPYLLVAVSTKEQEQQLRELSKKVGGNELPNMDCLINQKWDKPFDHLYLCVSDDFKESCIKCLHGWLDYSSWGGRIKHMPDFIDWYENEYMPLMNYEIIKHIPHASLELPKIDIFDRPSKENCKYNLKMSDVGIYQFFKWIPGIEVEAKYSRLYCDVERFKDNDKEPMAKLGQGYIYEKYYDGKPMLRWNSKERKREIDAYYDEHHKKLNAAVKSIFDKGKKVLLLDLHSYSDELANSLGKKGPYPDICIGINDEYYDEKILNLIIHKIKEKGYTYQINYPYEGSIIPVGILDGSLKGEICSIMLEVNKRIYL